MLPPEGTEDDDTAALVLHYHPPTSLLLQGTLSGYVPSPLHVGSPAWARE